MLTLARFPAAASGLWVTLYWGTVLVKAIRLSRKIGKDPNVLPREKTGLILRMIWFPTIIAWCTLPWIAVLRGFSGYWLWRSLWPMMWPAELLGAVAAAAGFVAFVLTLACWRQMGRSWRIGIDPGERTEMIVHGAYQWVRHPIYTLSIVLMITTLLAVPTPLMLAVACVHIVLITLESLREERYMQKIHGESYNAYRRRTGRFIPRWMGTPRRDGV